MTRNIYAHYLCYIFGHRTIIKKTFNKIGMLSGVLATL